MAMPLHMCSGITPGNRSRRVDRQQNKGASASPLDGSCCDCATGALFDGIPAATVCTATTTAIPTITVAVSPFQVLSRLQ